MIRLRPYKDSDAATILTWCKDEASFYRWTAGVLGPYPLDETRFGQLGSLMRFTALNDTEIVGFFTMRNPEPTGDVLRFGFVIVDPVKRGMGYGKAMLQLGLKYARDIYGAKRVTLGVFENNPAAYHCYKAVGFRDIALSEPESYAILGESWNCL